MESLIDQFNTSINSAQILGIQIFNVLQVLGYVFACLLFIGFIYLIIKHEEVRGKMSQDFKNHFIRRSAPKINVRMERWGKVVHAMSSGDEQQWRAAIVDADIMLEEVVDALGYQGETFGEKLKTINPREIVWLDAAWEVHRLRNILAHEGSRYPFTHREAYRAYKIYENILYETGYLS